MMVYKVIRQHRSEYPEPIQFSKGVKLSVGEKYDGAENWNDWFYCRSEDNKEGWVPKQVFILESANTGTALEDYTAQELDVDVGNIVQGSRVLNGWLWCENNQTEKSGWVPMEKLELMKI